MKKSNFLFKNNEFIVLQDINYEEVLAQADDISKDIANGKSYIIKNLYSSYDLIGLIKEAHAEFLRKEPVIQPIKWGTQNFWRLDDNPPASTIPKRQVLYFLFGWNSEFEILKKIGNQMSQLRNKIAGLDVKFGSSREDSYYSYTVIQHYPLGGGFISKHQDPLEPQKAVISLTLNKEFDEGGLYINTDGENTLIEELFDAGDIFIFRPNIFHGVEEINPNDKPIDYRAFSGRWRLANILAPSNNNVKTDY